MRDDSERLRDIVEAIDNIERYAYRGKELFDRTHVNSSLDYSSFADDW